MKRMTYLAAAGALVATSGLGAWAADAATAASPSAHVQITDRHGSDDPVGHHRHGGDDPVGHHRHGGDDPVGHHSSGRAGADAQQRRHDEPGDDHGGRHGGDDHGGRHGHRSDG